MSFRDSPNEMDRSQTSKTRPADSQSSSFGLLPHISERQQQRLTVGNPGETPRSGGPSGSGHVSRSNRQALEDAEVSVIADSWSFDWSQLLDFFNGSMLTSNGLSHYLLDPQHHYDCCSVSLKLGDTTSENATRKEDEALNLMLVELGIRMLRNIKGPHFTSIMPSSGCDHDTIVDQVHNLVSLFRQADADIDRIVVSIPATESGIRATRIISSTSQIKVNLVMVVDVLHAGICADAGAVYVTFDFSVLTDANNSRNNASPPNEVIQAAASYFSLHNLHTKIIVRGLEHITEIQRFPGVRHVCVGRDQEGQLRERASPTMENLKHSLSSIPLNSQLYQLYVHTLPHPSKILKREYAGSFFDHLPSYSRSVITTLTSLDMGSGKAKQIIRDGIVKYSMYCTSIRDPVTGPRMVRAWGYAKLIDLIEMHQNFAEAYDEWVQTPTGRIIEWDVDIKVIPTNDDGKGGWFNHVEKEVFPANSETGTRETLVLRIPGRFT